MHAVMLCNLNFATIFYHIKYKGKAPPLKHYIYKNIIGRD